MNDFKKINLFVNEQIEDFFEDLEDSEKRIKLFTSFSKIRHKYEMTDIKISTPKKKFQSKVKLINKKQSKGNIF